MKTTSLIAIIISGGLMISSAQAADIYGGGSTKDAPGEAYASPATHAGFYVTGILGYAWGDRDIRQNVTRDAGVYQDIKRPVEADFDKDKDGKLSDGEKKKFDEATADFNKDLDANLKKYPGSSYDGATFLVPLIGDALTNADSDDFNSFVYGAELSYLFQRGAFGLEPAIGVTFYSDGDSEISHKGAHGTFTRPSSIAGTPVPSDLPGSKFDGAFGQTGYASAEREMDIDLLLRGYYFLRPNFALTAAGGVSIATAEVCTANSSDAVKMLAGNPSAQSAVSKAFNTSKCDDDTSIGPMIEGGFKWWSSDRIAIVGRIDGKWHDFEGDASSFHKVALSRDGKSGAYGKSDNNVSVDDMLWTAKIGVSIKLD